MASVVTILWSNRKLIGEIIGVCLLLFITWWFFWHNPKVIKQLETEKAAAISQRDAAYNAINMLGEIERSHNETDKQSNDNMGKILTGRKPGRAGVFVANGVLPAVYSAYSTAN